ncbi:hypothetical protein FT663_01673 [Candidozyma haemuli var. vulneris]|uniref:PX domain-containing protein n=1 Tax=Candidozyma haemuli TaxID=45357 RepID=A0A2V1AQL8_9ASCO|nr:hypothetical protein CXQ85_001803 [[Candida] haemuloni]KAF3990598.1 hypothetical protein FT662_02159 [[Candida] haemuloni var. vulneris]KAF3993963.1 hypothetical protein FT663_01673 [[Candida] haemuloni var. vulneris]PVH20024.1 hypothetical protein CXQ85_001803 [[Candida] haemuloni]
MDDDLTASHWDDVLSPSTKFGTASAIPSHLGNQFADLNLDDPHRDNEPDEEEEEEDQDEQEDENETGGYGDHHGYGSSSYGGVGSNLNQQNQAELDQIHELRKEELKEQKSALMSELTEGSAFEDLESSVASPSKVSSSDPLFADRGKVLTESNATEPSPSEQHHSPKKASQLKGSQFRAQRTRRYTSSTVVKQLKEETGVVDPLTDLASKPEVDEAEPSSAPHDKANDLVKESNAPLYDIKQENADERQSEISQPISDTASDHSKLKRRPSSSGAEIAVGNPVKVGDITNAHIVYSIETRNLQLSPAEEPQENRFTVTRRYRDFCWVYKQLQISHPGKIIPPPPSKKTYIGRFNENFIENRRLSLEKMLQKISKIQSLSTDPSFVIFLTSEDFARDSKERERSGGVVLDDSGEPESDGASTNAVVTGSGTGGFMSSLFSIPAKLPEPDSYFSKKKAYIEDLEHNLRTFHRSLELIAGQRLEIVGVTEEIATIIDELADLEISKATSLLLKAFAEIHMKLKDNLDRVNLQDQLTLGFTIEEYLRIIGSVKYIFETRTKTYNQYHTFQQDLIKKEDSLNRASHKAKSEKYNILKFEVDNLRQKTTQFEKSFNAISETIKEEMDNFEMERVDDFRNSVEIYIESSIESQKEAIELWETFYERQHLDQI